MVDQRIIDHYADMDIDELEMELADLNNAIEVEQYRANHSYSYADMAKHLEKAQKYFGEAAYVRKLIEELMNG